MDEVAERRRDAIGALDHQVAAAFAEAPIKVLLGASRFLLLFHVSALFPVTGIVCFQLFSTYDYGNILQYASNYANDPAGKGRRCTRNCLRSHIHAIARAPGSVCSRNLANSDLELL